MGEQRPLRYLLATVPVRHDPDDSSDQDDPAPLAELEALEQLARLVAVDYLAGYRGHTQAGYRRDLADFFTHCHHVGVSPLVVQRSHIAGYLQTLQTAGRSPATLARRLVAIRGFYDLAVTEYHLPRSPAARIRFRRPRSQARIPALTLAELRAFLAAADSATPRTRGLAWLLASTGIRISEACTARIEDLTDTGTGIGTEPWLIITGKGGVRRSVPIHAAPWTRLHPLLAAHRGTGTGSVAGAGPLFATRTGRCLDRHAAARDLASLAATAGISASFSPHVLRHTFVTLARQAGCRLEDVQDAAGHADPATTRAYDRTLLTHADHPGARILAVLAATPATATATEARSWSGASFGSGS